MPRQDSIPGILQGNIESNQTPKPAGTVVFTSLVRHATMRSIHCFTKEHAECLKVNNTHVMCDIMHLLDDDFQTN